MTINKLYFSTDTHNWLNNGSQLLNYKNIDYAINNTELTNYHTSIPDIKTENIQKVCRLAREIYIVGITSKNISDLDYIDSSIIYPYGRLFNELHKMSHKVHGLECINDLTLDRLNSLCTINLHKQPVLWTAGCSVTHGVGVLATERWGNILSRYLNMPEVTLSSNGASIKWAADQLLRSDIKQGDIVVWGLTTFQRAEYALNWELKSNTVANIYRQKITNVRYSSLDYYDSTTHIVDTIRSILQVINFCKKIGVQLYLANLLEITLLPIILKDHTYFIDLAKEYDITETATYMDIGTDGVHPGPKQQQYYADQIFNFIKKC